MYLHNGCNVTDVTGMTKGSTKYLKSHRRKLGQVRRCLDNHGWDIQVEMWKAVDFQNEFTFIF